MSEQTQTRNRQVADLRAMLQTTNEHLLALVAENAVAKERAKTLAGELEELGDGA